MARRKIQVHWTLLSKCHWFSKPTSFLSEWIISILFCIQIRPRNALNGFTFQLILTGTSVHPGEAFCLFSATFQYPAVHYRYVNIPNPATRSLVLVCPGGHGHLKASLPIFEAHFLWGIMISQQLNLHLNLVPLCNGTEITHFGIRPKLRAAGPHLRSLTFAKHHAWSADTHMDVSRLVCELSAIQPELIRGCFLQSHHSLKALRPLFLLAMYSPPGPRNRNNVFHETQWFLAALSK